LNDSLNGWHIAIPANGVAAVAELDAKAFGMIITSGGSERSDYTTLSEWTDFYYRKYISDVF
jgi:hypothetical protein